MEYTNHWLLFAAGQSGTTQKSLLGEGHQYFVKPWKGAQIWPKSEGGAYSFGQHSQISIFTYKIACIWW